MSAVVELEVVFLVGLEVSEPGVVFVALGSVLASVFDVAEPQASVGIPPPFGVSIPVSAAAVRVDSSGHPTSLAVPNADYYASSSSSVGAVGKKCGHNSTDAHANYALCSMLSNPGLHRNRKWGSCYNKPNRDHDNVSDTNDLPTSATTSRSKRRGLHLYQEQRKHRWRLAGRPPQEERERQWVAEEKFQH